MMEKILPKEMRKVLFDKMEAAMQKSDNPEDRIFALHPDEGHIIVSHALFLIMSKPLVCKLPRLRAVYLLRQLEEEMLAAYLAGSEEFPELLRYCNLMYDILSCELAEAFRNSAIASDVGKLQAAATTAVEYGGDMDKDTVDDILAALDFDRNDKICCPLIERMLPRLQKMAESTLAHDMLALELGVRPDRL